MTKFSGNKLLVVGSLPPPIGGVSIHTKRLLDHLYRFGKFETTFFNIKGKSLIKLLYITLNYKLIHLHTSNVYFRLIFSLFGKIFSKKIVLTFHGNLGRFSNSKNKIDLLAIITCHTPIVLNQNSFLIAKKYNSNVKKIGAFLPPLNTECISEDLVNQIKQFKISYSPIFCTNAYGFTIDKFNQEIYGILDLIEIFQNLPKKALIISDPSKAYYNYIIKHSITIPFNILLLSYEHNFFEILKMSDIFIRNTSTDGDSLSIKEALYLNKIVLATNCVDRPSGCVTFERNNLSQLTNLIKNSIFKQFGNGLKENNFEQICNLYTSILTPHI